MRGKIWDGKLDLQLPLQVLNNCVHSFPSFTADRLGLLVIWPPNMRPVQESFGSVRKRLNRMPRNRNHSIDS